MVSQAIPQTAVPSAVAGREGPGGSARICESCRKTRLSGYNPGTVCVPCERALPGRQ
jgi:hypothetical protein